MHITLGHICDSYRLQVVLITGQQTAWGAWGMGMWVGLSCSFLNDSMKPGSAADKLNEGLPPAGQSPSDALARNKHQILVHNLRTILHRCMRRGDW